MKTPDQRSVSSRSCGGYGHVTKSSANRMNDDTKGWRRKPKIKLPLLMRPPPKSKCPDIRAKLRLQAAGHVPHHRAKSEGTTHSFVRHPGRCRPCRRSKDSPSSLKEGCPLFTFKFGSRLNKPQHLAWWARQDCMAGWGGGSIQNVLP